MPFPGPLFNSVLPGKGAVSQKNPDLALDPSPGFIYPGSVVSGELDSLRETDQRTLSQNVQETKPTPATVSLPNEF